MRLAKASVLLVVAACGSFGSEAAPVVVTPAPTDDAAPPGDDGGTTGSDGGDAGESEAGADAGRNCDETTPFGDPMLIDGMMSTVSSAGSGGEIISAALSPDESQLFYTLNYPNLLMQRVMRVPRQASGTFDSAVEAIAPSSPVKSYFSPTLSRAGDQMYLGATLLDGSFRLTQWKVDANGLYDSLVVTAPLPVPVTSPFFQSRSIGRIRVASFGSPTTRAIRVLRAT